MIVAWEEPFGLHGQTILQRMVGALLAACAHCRCKNLPVNLIRSKMHATGNSRALKPDMILAAQRKWGTDGKHGEWDEHMADASWVADYARNVVLKSPKVEGLDITHDQNRGGPQKWDA
jgi:hypothetical protein